MIPKRPETAAVHREGRWPGAAWLVLGLVLSCLALGSCKSKDAAAEGQAPAKAKSSAADPLAPQPRLVSPLPGGGFAPKQTDPAWVLFQEGMDRYREKRLGESLDAFKKAISERQSRSAEAMSRLDAATSDRDSPASNDSIAALMAILARKDMLDRDYERIHREAAGSLGLEIAELRRMRLSDSLSGLLSALEFVLEQRGASRIGDSLESLRESIAQLSHYPEAEFWIGKIFLAEGESGLARLQLQRAYDMRESLDLPEEGWVILESLAEVHRAQGNYRDYEDKLRAIADSSIFFSDKDRYLREAMERNLRRDGFDKFMILYRVEEAYPLGAYSKLGALYLENGRPTALIHLAAAANIVLTRIIKAIQADDPGYQYSSLGELLARIAADQDFSSYARASGLYENLFLLGRALAVSGSVNTARSIWRSLAEDSGSGNWGKQARAAL